MKIVILLPKLVCNHGMEKIYGTLQEKNAQLSVDGLAAVDIVSFQNVEQAVHQAWNSFIWG